MRQALVVDDESDARDFVRAILESEGWAVAEAPDGASALEQARSLRPELVVLDVLLPNKSGFDVFGELIRHPETRDIRVIMLTGVGEKASIPFSAGDMGEYFGKEPDAYMEKPIYPEAFKRLVRKVVPAA